MSKANTIQLGTPVENIEGDGFNIFLLDTYISTEEFRLSKVNLETFRHNEGQLIQIVDIGLPTLDSRYFQRNLSRNISE